MTQLQFQIPMTVLHYYTTSEQTHTAHSAVNICKVHRNLTVFQMFSSENCFRLKDTQLTLLAQESLICNNKSGSTEHPKLSLSNKKIYKTKNMWEIKVHSVFSLCKSAWSLDVQLCLTRVWQNQAVGEPGTHFRWNCLKSWCDSWSCCCCEGSTLEIWQKRSSEPDTASGWGNACHGPPGGQRSHKCWILVIKPVQYRALRCWVNLPWLAAPSAG